jgi:predicted ester cyclase
MRQFARVVLAALVVAGPSLTIAVAGEAENEAVARRFYTEFNLHHLDAFNQLMAGNFVDHNPSPDQKPGVQGLIDLNKVFIAAFDDIKVNPELVIAKGDYVTVYSTVVGTQTGGFFGVAATKKQIDFTSIDIWLVKDGKLAEVWHVKDILAILGEIGAIKM